MLVGVEFLQYLYYQFILSVLNNLNVLTSCECANYRLNLQFLDDYLGGGSCSNLIGQSKQSNSWHEICFTKLLYIFYIFCSLQGKCLLLKRIKSMLKSLSIDWISNSRAHNKWNTFIIFFMEFIQNESAFSWPEHDLTSDFWVRQPPDFCLGFELTRTY